MSRLPSPPVAQLLGRFGRLSNRDRMLLAEAVFWLALSRIALKVCPFSAIAARLGAFSAPTQTTAGGCLELSEEQRRVARKVGWSVTRAARYVPFRAVCLPQAIAAKMMLRRRQVPSVLHFGVAIIAGGPLKAHAWLDAADVQVTGFPIGPEFKETARFV
jgi:hypothetical protein